MAGLQVVPLEGMPLFGEGMSVAAELLAALERMGLTLEAGDIVVVAQKIVSKAEGRTSLVDETVAGDAANELAKRSDKSPQVCQIILDESSEILRATPAAIIARHKSGHVLANAGIDSSNVEGGEGGTVLLWPKDCDASARAIR